MTTRILFAATKWGGSPYYRMYLPSIHMRTLPEVESLMTTNIDRNTVEIFKPDAVVLQWVNGQRSVDFVRWCHFKKIKVLVDIDDDIWSYKNKEEWTEERIREFEQILKWSDGVVAASDVLKDMVSRFHSNVATVGNYVDWDSFNPAYERPKNEKVRIGWYGSESHEQDFAPSLCEWLKEMGRDVDLIMFGHMPKLMEGYARFVKGVEPLEFMKTLQSLNLDIGLVVCNPLVEFNEAKTPIKLLELGALGIPIVCDRAKPYLPFVDLTYSAEITYRQNWTKDKAKELQRIVLEEHSWQTQKQKVWEIYKSLL